ncbi:LuxR C-terminal-related transcriptional regulator [Mucilaginibacter sp. PAMB04168]|uniref:LuxR C-terminal-related transcriptional regulator n=1 Tax=Mucilaginibacter sp. PAMB04168 TaxID=3138567 RepID=UPI0031F6A8DC
MQYTNPAIYQEAQKIWATIASDERLKGLGAEIELHQSLLHLFCVGSFYHYMFNIRRMDFEFISPEMPGILGYRIEQINAPFFLSLIHPDDLPYFMLFEKQVVKFFNPMEEERIVKYKVRYDFRIKRADGQYIRILHQMLNIIPDQSGIFVNTLCVHTDITYLKRDGTPTLSFIGMQGEPSYIDVGGKAACASFLESLSRRERQIVILLTEGCTSKEIGMRLFISTATVSTHRKNILKKTGLASTPELVASAITQGWI